jgi:hypothetical protein
LHAKLNTVRPLSDDGFIVKMETLLQPALANFQDGRPRQPWLVRPQRRRKAQRR